MQRNAAASRRSLGLRPGEIVEVRSASEILATLDAGGALDALPLMPEMLQFCGQQFRVYKRADKTCDTIRTSNTYSRRMIDAVHLEGTRCDGSSHGGCQAQCLMFWKEAWLKRPEALGAASRPTRSSDDSGVSPAMVSPRDLELLQLTTRRAPALDRDPAVTSYVCQATELVRATSDLPWWDARQYLREVISGNVGVWAAIRTLGLATINALQRLRDGRQFPSVEARCEGKTPTGALNLQAGELVRIRSKEDIFATLNQQGRNRGLWFDVEMLPFCGRSAVVKQRVDHIINEKTGEMMHFSNPCIMLEGVACGGCLSRERLFCPRSIYSYWREIWLERVPVAQELAQLATPVRPEAEGVTAGVP
jgi:hypothetical protein